MIVTTTNSIEKSDISRYNDPIATNVVIGTNIFSDIGASYGDFFGGCSTNYEKKMQKCLDELPKSLNSTHNHFVQLYLALNKQIDKYL